MRHSPQQFRIQAECYLRLAGLSNTAEQKVQLVTIACAWHQLAQEQEIDVQRLGL